MYISIIIISGRASPQRNFPMQKFAHTKMKVKMCSGFCCCFVVVVVGGGEEEEEEI